jgi:pyruvate-ferredoxin/flavodoxin oxidoreductase
MPLISLPKSSSRKRSKKSAPEGAFPYPGVRAAMDGNTAVIACERESTDAAGAYPITPSTQMGEGWAENAAAGHINISDRPLIFIEPEGEHAAAAVTAGLSMSGLRAANFSSGQGIAYMHESLYAAVGKRLTYILNIGARAMTKSTLNVHAGHDDYHCIDDTGFFQMFAKNAQAAADLNIISHRIAELSLTPGALAQDGFLTTHLIESLLLPERALIEEYLGKPEDIIETPTAAQRILYGETRRRIPLLWDVDNPIMSGLVENQDSYMQSVAAQRPYFFAHVQELADQAFMEFYRLTGRLYARTMTHLADDAEYLIVGQGSVVPSAAAVADYLREKRGLKVGVLDMVMFRPFPEDHVTKVLKGKKGVVVLERIDQPLAVELPLVREIRSAVGKAVENGRDPKNLAYPGLAAYTDLADLPKLYSASFGMGSRDLQPEGIIGAVENMLPGGANKKFFYLSIDFLRDEARTPKEALHQEALAEAYPDVADLAVRGSENPNLMPPGSVTVRFHSVGGWGAITTGKNLAMTLFELLGYHIKANPKYGSEKKGQPTTYYLSASPEPIQVNCEYVFVDVVMSPDPNVFGHTNALHGLKEGGTFIIQSDRSQPEQVWDDIPAPFQKEIKEKNIKVFAVDAFKIAREEATDSDLVLRMQGIAFQGAFFAASPVMEQSKLDEATLLDAIHAQLKKKFGAKGARVVADNLRVVKRGFDEVRPVPYGAASKRLVSTAGIDIPVMVRDLPQGSEPISDVHRFWEQTGTFYARGQGNDNLADPFIALGTMPATTALFRDMTGIRFHHPDYVAENCTACGNCYAVCPDTAIPGLVTKVGDVLGAALDRVKKSDVELEHLPKVVRSLEAPVRALLNEAGEGATVGDVLEEACEQAVTASGLEGDERKGLREELEAFRGALNGFKFSVTRPHWTLKEKDAPGTGALFSVTVNPYTCKGCMECIEVCDDDALVTVTQTAESIDRMRDHWDLWRDLPNTDSEYIRIDDLEEGIGSLDNILLDKDNYLALTSGDGACLGCAEKTSVHLFTATVEALMRPRVAAFLTKLDGLIERLRQHIQLRLVKDIDVTDLGTVKDALAKGGDLTLAGLAEGMQQGETPIDRAWLERTTSLLGSLEDLQRRYLEGGNGRGRASMGMINATGCTSVWGSTYPFNPYPFPWSNHLFQDTPSVAMGIFEGHMAKMAQGFKAVRKAELELDGKFDPKTHDDQFRTFDWHDFTDEEWELCPPVVALGGDGAMYDIGFQNLSRLLASMKPVKVLVLDTQVYSNTGGQACTSGFIGQVSDMAQYGKAQQGKIEPRKEIGLIGMAHRTTYVAQSTIAHPNHMIESFIKGLKARRPALFNIYASCQPEHGIGDDMARAQAKLAVESRAYPLFRYDPDAGETPEECFDLEGNPAMDDLWPTYTLAKGTKKLELPMTFADFAITEARFRKHFRIAPQDAWNEQMMPLAEYLELDPDDRGDAVPFLWAVDKKDKLQRLVVSDSMVASSEDRKAFWVMLRALAGYRPDVQTRESIEAEVRQDIASTLATNLLRLTTDGTNGAATALLEAPAAAPAASPAPAAESDGAYLAPWIDTEDCTSCDECVNLNPKMFAYNDDKKAYIKDVNAGTYQDLVKAAERCTARVIHPGLPKDRSAKDADKWVKRGEKYN